MKGTYLFVVFFLFYGIACAQTVASEKTESGKTVLMTLDSTSVVVLSAEDTGLKASSLSKQSCMIAFIGCDEERDATSYFMQVFYTEYLKSSDYTTAFYTAKQELFIKYPDSPVTPVLHCKK